MAKRLTPEEMLTRVREALKSALYKYDENDWFFPSDVRAHNNSFKSICKKLYSLGLLERRPKDGFAGRWGYQYRIKP